jgi:phenylpropionate dioxygenase-like ring-hydroxylating dioxygenase large terminal subunit
MKSLLSSSAYISEDWFLHEQSKLFKSLWLFIAPRMLLSKPNAFVRRKLAGIDVVVQNMDGKIKAFENICAHRQSPVQTDSNGVRPLVCPYHAWRYGVNGEVVNIPAHDEAYRFTAEERECLKLRQFHVFEFGQLVFINFSKNPIDFWDQFDSASVESLKQASELFDDEVLVTSFKGKFNWKLAYENLRDSLHPQFLHARTVYKQVKFAARIDEAELEKTLKYKKSGVLTREEHLSMLRSFSGGGLNEPMPNLPHYQWHEYVQRYGVDDWYLNWLLYPNLHIASGSAGYSFIIEHHIPVSAGETDLWVYYVTGRKKRGYPTSSAVLLAHLEGAEKVLSEDIEIMEKVQLSLGPDTPTAKTGDFEHANMGIEKWYLDVLENRHAI